MEMSRSSGRARKKSAKLIEMEQSEVEFTTFAKVKGRKSDSDTALRKSPKMASPKAGTPKPPTPMKGSLSSLFPRVASVLESPAGVAAALPVSSTSVALKFEAEAPMPPMGVPEMEMEDQEEPPLEIDVPPVAPLVKKSAKKKGKRKAVESDDPAFNPFDEDEPQQITKKKGKRKALESDDPAFNPFEDEVPSTKKKGKRKAVDTDDPPFNPFEDEPQQAPSAAKKRKTKERKPRTPKASAYDSDEDFHFDDAMPEREIMDESGEVSDEDLEFEKFLPTDSDDTETDEDLAELERMRGSQVPALEGHVREPPKKKKEPPSFEKAEARKKTLKAKVTAVKKQRKEPAVVKQKPKRTTGYTLWCHSMRKQLMMQYPESDFAQVSRKLSELWNTVSAQKKKELQKRARALQRKQDRGEDVQMSPQMASTHLRSGMPTPAPKPLPPLPAPPGRKPNLSINNPNYIYKVTGHQPIDVAAHLKLLGESLATIGNRLQEHKGQIAVQGSLSVLLDSMLCALGPLTCLTTQVPQLNTIPPETHMATLDNLAYIMPGIG